MEIPWKITSFLTVGWNFKDWPSTIAAGCSGKASHDQLPIHKGSIECCPSIRVDVSYRFTSHVSILIHLPKDTATILDIPQYERKKGKPDIWKNISSVVKDECWGNSQDGKTSILHNDCYFCTGLETLGILPHQILEQGHWVHHQHMSHIGHHHLHLYTCPDPAKHHPQRNPPECCERKIQQVFNFQNYKMSFLTYRKRGREKAYDVHIYRTHCFLLKSVIYVSLMFSHKLLSYYSFPTWWTCVIFALYQ